MNIFMVRLFLGFIIIFVWWFVFVIVVVFFRVGYFSFLLFDLFCGIFGFRRGEMKWMIKVSSG